MGKGRELIKVHYEICYLCQQLKFVPSWDSWREGRIGFKGMEWGRAGAWLLGRDH